MRGTWTSFSLVAALALVIAPVRAPPLVAGPASPLDKAGREQVTYDTADGFKIAGTYSAVGSKPGSPVVLLVHGEGQTRQAFAPLADALEEHLVPWLAIDLRGHGRSAEQDGKDLAGRTRDPAFCAGFADDVYGAVRWLVDAKRHDPKRIGILAAAIGSAAAFRVAHLHKGEVASLVLLTPAWGHPGFDTKADAHDLDGAMDVVVLSSVEDMNRLEKTGPRAVLYAVERDRNAPPDTRREERVAKRRGIPPRNRSVAEKDVYGTKLIAGVAHMDAWLAGWFARRFETIPNAVLFDGSVDTKNDYADPGWDGGTVIPGGETLTAKALRWGTRVMVGGELPPDAKTVYLRVYATRGDGHIAGQYAQIAYPSGIVSAQALFKAFMGRAPPTETAALVLEPEEIPQSDGTITYGKPSFEAEIRLPDLSGDGPLEVRLSFTAGTGDGVPNVARVDPDKPETWTLIPDQLAGRPDVPGSRGAAPAPDPPETPDGPMTPKDPPKKH